MTRVPVSVVCQLAWRNLWRNYRRTGIMLAAIAVGVWAMVFMTAMMRGMVDDMIGNALLSLPGHVQIHHRGYRDDPSVVNSMPAPGDALLEALGSPDVEAWSARVRVPAVVSSEYGTRGVTLVGVDPGQERGVSFAPDSVSEGRFLESPGDSGLVIGRKMLENLETVLGRRVVVMSQDPENDIVDRGFRIVGVFDAKLEGTEEAFVFAGLDTVQKMLRMGDAVSEIAARGVDYRDVSGLQSVLARGLSEEQELLSWAQLDTYLGAMLATMDGFVLVWIVVIFLALSFGLVNTLVMAVFERVREIGLMQALGMRPVLIFAQVLVEMLLLLILGLAAGNLAAVATVTWLADGLDLSAVSAGMEMMGVASVLYPSLQLNDLLLANAVVVVLGVLAGVSPALRAARYQPVEAISKAA